MRYILIFIIFFSSVCTVSKLKASELSADYRIQYYIDSLNSFDPLVNTDVPLLRQIDSNTEGQGWIVVEFSNITSDQKIAMLFFSGGADFWIEDLLTGEVRKVNFENYKSDDPNTFTLEYLNRLDQGSTEYIGYINHYIFPLNIHKGDQIRVWGRPKVNRFGINDWQAVRLIPYDKLLKADALNAAKFIFFVGSAFILIVIVLFLSMRNIVKGGKFFVLLCLVNTLFIMGYYPLGSLLAVPFSEYLFPNYYVLPLSYVLYLLFAARFYGLKQKYIYVLIGIIAASDFLLIAIFMITRDHYLGNELLAIINKVAIPASLLLFLVFTYLGRHKRKQLEGRKYLEFGAIMSFTGMAGSAFMQGDYWYSIWVSGYDFQLFTYILEHLLFTLCIIRNVEFQIKEKAILSKTLEEEKLKVGKLTNETVQLKIEHTEKEQAVKQALEKLDMIKKTADKDRYSSELYKTIQILEKYDKDSNLYESAKLLINQSSPEFENYMKSNHPELTVNEKRLVDFYKLGLNNREIANLLNITVNSLYVIKNRLKKKLQLPKEQSVEQYIETIQD